MQKPHLTTLARISRFAFYTFLVVNISFSPVYPAIEAHAAIYGALIQMPDLSSTWHDLGLFSQHLVNSLRDTFKPVPQKLDPPQIAVHVNAMQVSTATPTAVPTVFATSTPVPAANDASYDAVAGDTSVAADIDANGEQQAHTSVGRSIDPTTGNYTYSMTDISLPGSGTPLAFRHIYSVRSLENFIHGTYYSSLSPGWTDNFNMKLIGNNNTLCASQAQIDFTQFVLTESNGSSQYFCASSTDGVTIKYTPEAGFYADMTRTGTAPLYTYTVLLRDHTRYQFNTAGQLTQIDHLSGLSSWNALTLMYSDGTTGSLPSTYSCPNPNADIQAGKLLRVTDTQSGSYLEFCYTGYYYLSEVHDTDGGSVANKPFVGFNYTKGELSSVTDLRGKTWTYIYGNYQIPPTPTPIPTCPIAMCDAPPPSSTPTSTPLPGVGYQINDALLTQVQDNELNVVEGESYAVDPKCTSMVTARCVKVQTQYHGNQTSSEQSLIVKTIDYSNSSVDGCIVTTCFTQVIDGNGNVTTYDNSSTDPFTGLGANPNPATAQNVSKLLSRTSNTHLKQFLTEPPDNSPPLNIGIVHDAGTTTNSFLPTSENANGGTTTFTASADNRFVATVTYSKTATRPATTQATIFAPYVDSATKIPFDLPSEVTDTAGNKTDYVYYVTANDASHGTANFPTLPIAITRTDVVTGHQYVANLYYYNTGWLEGIVDANNSQTLYTYNSSGQVVSKTLGYAGIFNPSVDAYNQTPPMYKDGDGTSDNNAQNITTDYKYVDEFGRLTDTINVQTGRADHIKYDDVANTITTILNITSLPQLCSSQSYDNEGNLISSTDANCNTTTYKYDSGARLRLVTTPDGTTINYHYDAADNVDVTTIYNSGSSEINTTTVTCHTSLGRPITSLQNATATAQPIDFAVADDFYCKTVVANENKSPADDATKNTPTFYGYDAATGKPAIVENDLYRTIYGYDALGRQTSVYTQTNDVTPTFGENWNFDYDLLGNVNQITQIPTSGTAANKVTWRCYDLNSQLIYQVQNEPSGSVPSCTTNSSGGNTLSPVTPAGIALPSGAQDADSQLTTFMAYDGVGQMTDSWDAINRQTHIVYDNVGRMAFRTTNYTGSGQSFNPNSPDLNFTQSFKYSMATQSTAETVTDSVQHGTKTIYDALGCPVSVTVNPSNNGTGADNDQNITTTYMCDGLGHVKQQTDPAWGTGAITRFNYDKLNRLTTVTDSTGIVISIKQYDDLGNVTSSTDANGVTTSYNYDNYSHLIRTQSNLVTTNIDYTHRFTVANTGNVTSNIIDTDGLGHQTSSVYDSFGKLMSVTRNYTGGTPSATSVPGGPNDMDVQTVYQYDGFNNLSGIHLPGDSSGSFSRSYVYDQANRVAQVNQLTTGGAISTWKIYYDQAGRQTYLTDPIGQNTTTLYDNLDEVTRITRTNMLDTTFQYSYDGSPTVPNQKTVQASANNVPSTLTYDSLDRLTGLSGGTSLHTAAFTYNADGQQTSVTTGAALPSDIPIAVTLVVHMPHQIPCNGSIAGVLLVQSTPMILRRIRFKQLRYPTVSLSH